MNLSSLYGKMPVPPSDYIPIQDEFPYRPDQREDSPLERNRPYICLRCGSKHTSSYVRLMSVSGPKKVISGDLIFRPVEVVNCMHGGSVWYHNFSTLRDV